MPRYKAPSRSSPSAPVAPADNPASDKPAAGSSAEQEDLSSSNNQEITAPTGPVAEPRTRPRTLTTTFRVLVPLVLLAILFLQLYFGVRRKSATLDEQNHIARGLAFLRTGDLRLNLIHPPLINVISALPLLRDNSIKLPLDDVSWRTADYNGFGVQLLWVKNDNGPSIVARARVPIMVLTVFLGGLVFIWAYELYGWPSAVLTLALLCFDPNILAHGALATNDLGMTCFTCLALYAFWRLLKAPGWIRAAMAGVALGLALTAKFSSVFLFVALPATALVSWALSSGEERTVERLKRLALLSTAVIGAAFLTLWAVYGFQLRYATLSGFPIPAKAYLDGLQFARTTVTNGRSAFLLGMYSETGWWYYFPVAFLVKTPLPTLLLLVCAVVFVVRTRAWKQSAILLTPVVIYFALAMTSPLEIGYRHLLPILPMLFIFIGQLAISKARSGVDRQEKAGGSASKLAWMKWAAVLLMLLLIVEAVRIYPDYLTYFNLAAGGPSGGKRILADSNLDWGQDLPGLRGYMDREKLDSIKLSYFGSSHPEAYGITNFDPLPSYPYNYHGVESKVSELSHPPAGVYAISMTDLQGVFFKDHGLYGWFGSRQPDTVIGHSICIYRVK
jgi:hypothetical protein